MWTRFELKERGKAAFQRNYWRSVLVAFILMLFVSGGGSAVSNSWNQITSSGTSDDSYYTEYFDDGDIGHFYYNSGTSIPGMLVSGIIAVVVGGVMIVSALLGIFLFNPLEVGGCRFFMENSEYQPTVGRLGFAFQKGMYGKTVLTLFLRILFSTTSLAWSGVFSSATSIISNLQYLLRRFEYSAMASRRNFSLIFPTVNNVIFIAELYFLYILGYAFWRLAKYSRFSSRNSSAFVA